MLVARKHERQTLRSTLDDEYSQFVAVYGRRRVGKTFLVRESFDYSFTFQHAGLANAPLKDQLFAFTASLKDAGLLNFDQPKNWLQAFELLKDLIRQSPSPKKVIFIDELSWMDTPKSNLMVALESFWNGWASARKDIVLIVCASATSWMIEKVVHNKGGLYNRLTKQIALRPFTLAECEEYVRANGLAMSRDHILQTYMVLGGIPFYWGFLRKELGPTQNIDALFFEEGAPLADEFGYLYASLFKNPEGYVKIVEALATKKCGMSRSEIVAATGTESSGKLSRQLDELESCGFIRSYRSFGHKSRDIVYQLIDNFTLFYYQFMVRKPTDRAFWTNRLNSPARNAWSGLAFERVCLQHADQIKRALGISGMQTDVQAWSCKADPDRGVSGSQIDLIVVRKDQVINICEMKYATLPYSITKQIDQSLKEKLNDFAVVTKTRSALHLAMVTPFGLNPNAYSGNVQSTVTADDLFA